MGLDMQNMVEDAFLQYDEPPISQPPLQGQLEHIVMETLTIVNKLANVGGNESIEGTDDTPWETTKPTIPKKNICTTHASWRKP